MQLILAKQCVVGHTVGLWECFPGDPRRVANDVVEAALGYGSKRMAEKVPPHSIAPVEMEFTEPFVQGSNL